MRYDVAAIKARFPGQEVKVHAIERPSAEEIVEFSDAREAYDQFCGRFGSDAQKAYPDEIAFRREFDACAKRDSLDGINKSTAPVKIGEDPERVAGIDALNKVEQVTPAIAESLYDAGYRSIESVAAATLDELESVDGITPSISDDILASATAILAAA
jgi:predicted flap endonuclease-1-like 5' DNA nuclease